MDVLEVEESFQTTGDGKCSVAGGGMVATAFPLATEAGVEMLRKGGNAVDAACAAAFSLAVCEPQASGIGGQTMAILHLNGRTVMLDGSGRAPSLAHAASFKDREQEIGYRGTTVPSTPAVLGRMHQRYGSLPWRMILEPGIRIARQGYAITQLQNRLQTRELPTFEEVPSRSGCRYFLKNQREPYGVGDLFRQPELAALLETLAEEGPEAFYLGRMARRIDEDMQANGGFLRAEDLALIPWPVERPPIQSFYRGFSILTTSPPTQGRILVLDLKLLEYLSSTFVGSGSPQAMQFLAEIFRTGLQERKQNPIRPDLYHPDDDPVLNDESYIRQRYEAIKAKMNFEEVSSLGVSEGGETTHLSTMDGEGNAVGLTQSINLVYGSKAAAEGLGFLYNNYLQDMERSDPSHPHYLGPNSIPWSSVSPTIVMRCGEPWMVAGSPSSERIVSVVLQFLSHVIDGGLSLCEAMKRPRLHCSVEGRVTLEADRFDPAVMDHLARVGYELNPIEPYSFYLGAIHAVLKRQTGEGFQGVAEIRRDGTAGGPG